MPSIADAVRDSYIFSGLTEAQTAQVISLAKEKVVEGGQQLVRQFAKDNDVLVIAEGKARVNTFSGDLIAEAGPGASIGEMALIDDKPRSATVIAMGRVVVGVISRDDLMNLMDQEPSIGKTIMMNIARILTERLRRANIELDMSSSR